MEHWTDRLSEYLDGELSTGERKALEAHLVACSACAATLVELRSVVEGARRLENRPPDHDLWPLIEARLTSGRAGVARRWIEALLPRGGRLSLSIPQLAAAAAALMIVSAGAMWFASRPARVPEPVANRTAPAPAVTAAFADFDQARYDATVADLERVLREHRAELDTSTVRIVEQNLAIIDRATDEARSALLADPRNAYLHGHLAEQMMRKVRLLQRATSVVAAQG